MGRQQEPGNSGSHVFGGAVPPAKPFTTGAFMAARQEIGNHTLKLCDKKTFIS
jgi:hypothetical protein